MAAKCTARRLVPDYISEKKMKEYKLSKGEREGEGGAISSPACGLPFLPDQTVLVMALITLLAQRTMSQTSLSTVASTRVL